MADISSPVVYPPSSSPDAAPVRKRPANSEPDPPTKRRLFNGAHDASSKDVLARLQNHTAARDTAAVQKPQFIMPSHAPFVEDAPEDDQATAAHEGMSSVEQSVSARFVGQRQSIETVLPIHGPRGRTSTGRQIALKKRKGNTAVTFERLIAARSTTTVGRAARSFYGIDIHRLMDEAKELQAALASRPRQPVLATPTEPLPLATHKKRFQMWTEKYRARKFTDLVGDERNHRGVLGWLKQWDSIVFPGSCHSKPRQSRSEDGDERQHRKVLLLTGPPGLGKTTLAHVCARQAGYEVVEINASDERSRNVVNGKIRDCLGTENVRGINVNVGSETVRKAGRPICVVVDEVDGVVTGASGGGGEGGFTKALIDLILLDQKNCSVSATGSASRKRKGDTFKLQRPLVLVCNDVYHPSLRPLRTSGLAEIIYTRKPSIDKVILRVKAILEKEWVKADRDAVRRLCEAAWGVSSSKEARNAAPTGAGDIRSVLVMAEWAATKLRAMTQDGIQPHLTRQWLEDHIVSSMSSSEGPARGSGRGGAREAVDRIFLDGAGFPKVVVRAEIKTGHHEKETPGLDSVVDVRRGHGIALLRSVLHTCNEHDRVIADAFGAYPTRAFQDDTYLSKPNAACDWLHFHDALTTQAFSGQEWELHPYMPQGALGFHYLFAAPPQRSWSSDRPENVSEDADPSPFSGPRADFEAREEHQRNHGLLQAMQPQMSLPLLQAFRSPEDIAVGFAPYLNRILNPDIKPVVIGGGGDQKATATVRRQWEKERVRRAVEAMSAVGLSFERSRVEDLRGGHDGFVLRMEPPLDTLATFDTASRTTHATTQVRYAVRQVLDQEHQRFRLLRHASGHAARVDAEGPVNTSAAPDLAGKENIGLAAVGDAVKRAAIKRDFFGRVITNEAHVKTLQDGKRTELAFKPITYKELLADL